MSKKELGLDGHKSIDKFVNAQIEKLKKTNQNFSSLFEIMFSIKDNVMFEHTDGNKIFETTYGQCYDKIKLVTSNLIDKTKYFLTFLNFHPFLKSYYTTCPHTFYSYILHIQNLFY